MENPIVVTPQEIINTILALCGAIITISAAMTVIIKAVEKLRQPNKKQDERIESLELEVKTIKERLEAGNIQFRDDGLRMEQIETSTRYAMKVVIESLQALTAHAIDGNGIEELKESKQRLDKYLIEKI
jgi:uncharacterized membrane protein